MPEYTAVYSWSVASLILALVAHLIPNSAIFRAPKPELSATVSTVLGRVGGRMAELLMKSAIAKLTWRWIVRTAKC